MVTAASLGNMITVMFVVFLLFTIMLSDIN